MQPHHGQNLLLALQRHVLSSCLEAQQLKHTLSIQDYAKRIHPSSGNSKKGKNAKARASMTLKDLVDVGVILPGRNKISVFYKGINYVASLGKDGIIVYQGMQSCIVTESKQLLDHKQCTQVNYCCC